MSRLISIIGDGNVRRNMTGLNVASREAMKSAQVIDYVAPTSFESVFNEIRADSTVCIIAALTDLLLSGGDGGTIFSTIDPILDSFRARVFHLCTARPNLQASALGLVLLVLHVLLILKYYFLNRITELSFSRGTYRLSLERF